MERTLVLASGKCRRQFSPDHAAFAAGNALRETKFYQSMGLEPDDGPADDAPLVFVCRLFNCRGVGFRSLHAYEEHYDLVHRNVCRECFRSFVSYRLLDIHLSESHDAFFRVMAKRQPMYVCLVDGCTQVFKHDDKRTKHLVRDHQYPANFSFHEARKRTHLKREESEPKDVDAIKIAKAQARKQKRREKKKADAKERKQQAAAGMMGSDEMMNVDDGGIDREPVEPKPTELKTNRDVVMTEDEQEEDLAKRMKQLFIPRSISFGRRQPHRR